MNIILNEIKKIINEFNVTEVITLPYNKISIINKIYNSFKFKEVQSILKSIVNNDGPDNIPNSGDDD